MDKDQLVAALEATLVANDEIMKSIMDQAARQGIPPYLMFNRDGTYAMAPLLHTRAMVLSSLTALYTA